MNYSIKNLLEFWGAFEIHCVSKLKVEGSQITWRLFFLFSDGCNFKISSILDFSGCV